MRNPPYCPVKGVCLAPSQCAQAAGCVLKSAQMADWRADPTPYPLRCDTKPRAVFPAGVSK